MRNVSLSTTDLAASLRLFASDRAAASSTSSIISLTQLQKSFFSALTWYAYVSSEIEARPSASSLMSQNLRPSQHQNTYASGAFSWNLGDFGLDAVFFISGTLDLEAEVVFLAVVFEFAFLTMIHPQLSVSNEHLNGENAALRLKLLRQHTNHIIILTKWR